MFGIQEDAKVPKKKSPNLPNVFEKDVNLLWTIGIELVRGGRGKNLLSMMKNCRDELAVKEGKGGRDAFFFFFFISIICVSTAD